MLFLGDVCPFGKSVDLFNNVEIDALFSDVKSLFDNADFSFVNLECALTDCDNPIAKFGPNLKAPYNTAKTLKKLGVDCCGLSNNHIFDFGKEGALDTVKALEEAGIGHTGFGMNYDDARKNYIIDKNGERIALIAVCEHEYSYALENRMGSRPYDAYDTIEDIRLAKSSADRVIVIYHGGKEFCRYPSPRVRRICQIMVDNGADAVLCQHSHCVATYECYNGGHILHGQGNFHFTMPNDFEGWDDCVATIYDTKTGEIEFIPIKAEGNTVQIATNEQGESIMSAFSERNAQLKDGSWKAGWHKFCVDKCGYYLDNIAKVCTENALEEENAILGHYFDCEAHSDVCKELFPTYNETN